MLRQILLIEKHIAVRIYMLVPTCTTGFLHIVFKGIRYLIMDHKPHIALVHTHPESRGRHNYPCIATHERILVGRLLVRLHLAVICPGSKSVLRQSCRKGLRLACPGNIHYHRAGPLFNQTPQGLIFGLLIRLRKHLVVEVVSGNSGGEQLKFKGKPVLEISADVLDDLRLGRGSET